MKFAPTALTLAMLLLSPAAEARVIPRGTVMCNYADSSSPGTSPGTSPAAGPATSPGVSNVQWLPGTSSACTMGVSVNKGDTCSSIATFYGTTVAAILADNPGLSADCANLLAGVNVCLNSSGQ